MNAYQLKFWQPVKPVPDITAKNSGFCRKNAQHRDAHFSPFAAVVQQDPTCPQVYRDPCHFFHATYLTAELKQLFKGVLGGLCGQGQRVFSLGETGDISQTFLSLYHLVKYRPELRQFPQFLTLPDPKLVQVAGLTTFDLEVKSGMEIKPGWRVFTPWGYLAWQLGGSFAYSLVKIHDEQRVAPSEYLLRQLMGDRPTLLLVEDFLDYVLWAIAVLGNDAPFIPEILRFIENLMAVVEKSPYTVLVYSLPGTETNLLTAVKNLLQPKIEALGEKSLPKSRQFPTRMLRPLADPMGKNHQFSLRMVRRWKRENQAKFNSAIKEKKSAIAVVSLDEHTYYFRSGSRSTGRQSTPAKTWQVNRDRSPKIWFLSAVRKPRHQLITEKPPELNFVSKLGELNQINQRFSDENNSKKSIVQLFNQWHKLSVIDVKFTEFIARSPPKYYP